MRRCLVGRHHGCWCQNAAAGAHPAVPADRVERWATGAGAANNAGEPPRRREMKKILAVLVLILALLGVSRTPEAQVGLALTAATLAGNAIAIGGCVHMAATAKPDMAPMAPLPPEQ